MSGMDYLHCAVCGRKAIYDADLNYDHAASSEYGGLYDIAAICHECAKTHSIKIVEEPTVKRIAYFLVRLEEIDG